MGIAKYEIFGTEGAWRVRHDGQGGERIRHKGSCVRGGNRGGLTLRSVKAMR